MSQPRNLAQAAAERDRVKDKLRQLGDDWPEDEIVDFGNVEYTDLGELVWSPQLGCFVFAEQFPGGAGEVDE